MPVSVRSTNVLALSYDEPTESIDNSPLNDLKETRCYMRVLPDGLANVVKIQPASSLNGGGHVEVIAQANVLPNTQQDIEIWITAVDLVGNESPKSAVIQVRIDMVPPAAPLF